jgi:non-heme Fe2+,alpha-ketoglutarate-dependent halogenase
VTMPNDGPNDGLKDGSNRPRIAVDPRGARIDVEGLTLFFPLYHGNSRSLKKTVFAAATGRLGRDAQHRPGVQALRDISFHLAKGDRLGLVGANGAGKTTLLRTLAGVYEPVVGRVRVQGSINALLNVQLGMNPELTGRENITLRGLYDGLPRAALARLADDVASFADLGDFIDLPVRIYSSGMMVRLAFALATAIRPQILMMDEWILAGDAGFLDRARARLEDLVRGAEILVLSTHIPAVIRTWCTRVIWLDQGRVREDGPTDRVLDNYFRAMAPGGRVGEPEDTVLGAAVRGAKMRTLSEAAIRQYQDQGYIAPVPALSTTEAAVLRGRLEAYEGSAGALAGPLRQKTHLLFPWLNELIRHPRILDAVEDLIGPDILCWSTGFFTKNARDPSYVSWHQDSTYWGLEPPDIVTAWVAFSDSVVANGAMRVIPGSHRKEQLAHRDTFAPDNLLSRGQEISVEVDEREAVALELRAGEMSLHHVRLIHGSDPNPSDTRRIGFAIRYIPTYVRQVVGGTDSATLVRGEDRYHHFAAEQRPAFDMAPEAVAHHAAVAGAFAQILMRDTGKPMRA